MATIFGDVQYTQVMGHLTTPGVQGGVQGGGEWSLWQIPHIAKVLGKASARLMPGRDSSRFTPAKNARVAVNHGDDLYFWFNQHLVPGLVVWENEGWIVVNSG